MLFNYRRIKALILLFMLSCAGQTSPSIDVSKNAVFGISAGVGLAGLCGKLAWDKYKKEKTIGTKEMLWASICGLFAGGLTCLAVLPQTVEWKENQERGVFESLHNDIAKQLDDAKKFVESIPGKLPLKNEDLVAYAKKSYPGEASLYVAYRDLKKLRVQASKISEELKKQLSENKGSIAAKFVETKVDVQGIKTKIEGLQPQIAVMVKKLEDAFIPVAECVQRIGNHHEFQSCYEEYKKKVLEPKITKYNQVKAVLQKQKEENKNLLSSSARLSEKIIELTAAIVTLTQEAESGTSSGVVAGAESDICPICLESLVKNVVFTNCCKNQFHKKCINDCLKSNPTCPLCRKDPTPLR